MSDLLSFLSWWLLVTLFGLVAWPIVFRLFRFLPDHGYSLTKTAGLLFVGYAGWLLGNFGFTRVDAGGVMAAVFVVGAVSLLALRGNGEALGEWWRTARLSALLVEALFFGAFAIWTYVRALNPTITATEKPMEFAFLNSVLRTGLQPPGDPWLAGYAISYYHFGYVIMGMLTALSGVKPSVAFNLGIALLFALTATGAYGVVLNMIAAASGRHSPQTDDERESPPDRLPRVSPLLLATLPALMGPLFMLLGNFNGALEVAHKSGWFASPPEEAAQLAECPTDNRYCVICRDDVQAVCDPANYKSNFWSWLDIKWTNNPPSVLTPGDNAPNASGWTPDRFLWWWQSSRVIHDRNLFGDEVEVIDEFPFFSFLLGDMHPHVLGLPFVFLGITFAFNLFLMVGTDAHPQTGGADSASFWENLPRRLPLASPDLLGGAIILGGLSFLNTWDFPIYVFVAMAAYMAARALREGWTGNVGRDGAILGGSLVLVGAILYLPFYIGFRSQLGGILPNVIFGSRIQQFIVMFGPSLFGVLSVLGRLAVKERDLLDWQIGATTGLATLFGLIVVCVLLALFISWRPEAQSAITDLIGQTPMQEAFGLILRRRFEIERALTPILITLVLTAGAAIVFGLGRRGGDQRKEGLGADEIRLPVVPFLAVLIITGALLTLGPEFVYLRDFFGTRMNTIFKFYYQAWVLWSLAAAFGAWWLLRSAKPTGQLLFGSGLTVVVALGLIYPTLATATITDNWRGTTRDANDQPYATLDGMAYMLRNRGPDYNAINFLNAMAPGRPVIAEAVGGSYTEFARVSAHTGLPTVIGWPFHELQWRGVSEVFAGREEDMRTLYTSNNWDETLAILEKYDIRYVYIGPMEFNQYGQVATEKFERNLAKIYQADGVTIYEYRGAGAAASQ